MVSNPLEIGLIGGIEKRQIKIVDYDPAWPEKFRAHSRIIGSALGKAAVRIEHVGSTSVPSLAAKAIIDILVEVPNSSNESIYLPQLELAGYSLRVREPDWNEHRMFRTQEKDVHIHIYSTGCAEIIRNLAFRDHLRRNTSDRSRYEKLKRDLSKEEWPDMNAYAAAKTELIESIIASVLPEETRLTNTGFSTST